MVETSDLRLKTSMRCAKFMLLVVSLMFAITAILLVMVGTAIQSIYGDFSQFIDDNFSSPPALLIAIGFILLLVAFWGAYGAIRESVLVINLYGVFLFFVFILEVAAAIAGYMLQGQVRGMLIRTMNDSLAQYENNEYVQTGVDFMQSALQCCGIESPSDWKPYWSENNSTSTEENEHGAITIRVPHSCCGLFSPTDPDVCVNKFHYGCLDRMEYVISQSAMLLALGATSVAFVQLLGVFCAFMLAKTLRRNKSLRAARRWQLQQSLGALLDGGKTFAPTNSPLTAYTQMEKNGVHLENDPITYTPQSPSVN